MSSLPGSEKFPFERTCPFDPPPQYAQMRAQQKVCPVTLWDGSRAWLVTSHDEFKQALADPRFSSEMWRPGFPTASESRVAVDHAEKSFIGMDPPAHSRLRRMLTKEFTARRIESLRPNIERIVDRLLTDMIDGGPPTDLMSSFAVKLPSLLVCDWIGSRYEDHEFIMKCQSARHGMSSNREQAASGANDLVDYVAHLIDHKQKTPGDDMLSRLIQEHVATGALTRDELAQTGALLLRAGHDTTVNMITLGTALLLQHPDQRDALMREPGIAKSAVDELLRYLSPVQYAPRRIAREDVEIAGVVIPAGEGIFALTSAANRDEQTFPDPDTLDLQRNPYQHVAFGSGIHQCIGQGLARLELQIALPALFQRIPTLELAVPVEEIRFRTDMQIYGVYELPVRW